MLTLSILPGSTPHLIRSSAYKLKIELFPQRRIPVKTGMSGSRSACRSLSMYEGRAIMLSIMIDDSRENKILSIMIDNNGFKSPLQASLTRPAIKEYGHSVSRFTSR